MPVDHHDLKIIKLVDATSYAVDPNNPNVALRPMGTPGPDDNLGLPAVQTDNGLLLPAVQDHGLLLPAVRIGDGEANTPGALLFRFESDPVPQGGVQKGDWITDVTYELLGQPTVATETVTIAHEGFLFI